MTALIAIALIYESLAHLPTHSPKMAAGWGSGSGWGGMSTPRYTHTLTKKDTAMKIVLLSLFVLMMITFGWLLSSCDSREERIKMGIKLPGKDD